jgi:anti-anti-sigma factor
MLNLSSPSISLAGELDLSSVPDHERYLLKGVAAVEGPVLIDCTELTFCDSIGIAMVVRLVHATEGRLRLINVPERCRTVFTIAGVAETFGLASDSM